MVLTPDQKRRIADLEAKAPSEEGDKESPVTSFLAGIRAVLSKIQLGAWRPFVLKALVVLVLLGVAGYYVREYQLHRLDYHRIISSGNPVDGFVSALKEQKQKARMLEEARAQYLVGDLSESLATAASAAKVGSKDQRMQELIELASDAAVQRATHKLDVGEIEAALADVRLALKYRPDHQEGQQLILRIGERLFREASTHYSKKEYSQLITKAKEVIKINPSDMGPANLLVKTNNELLAQADELLYNRRYYEALEKVQLSLQIDPTNSRAIRLLESISLYVETPDIKLRGITKLGNAIYAVVQLPNSSQPVYLKKGEKIRNFRLIDIDPETRVARFLQIYTKAEFTIQWSKPD